MPLSVAEKVMGTSIRGTCARQKRASSPNGRGPDEKKLTRSRRAYAGEEPFNRDAAGKAKWHDQVMRHEGSAAALVFRVSVARDPKQERHLVYRIARAGACLPDPGSEGSAIFSRRYPPFPRRRYCGSATGLGHFALGTLAKNKKYQEPAYSVPEKQG